MTVAVVTDSAAALPAALVDRHQIGVVPLHLMVDGVVHLEGEQPADTFDGTHEVTTSGPAPGQFASTIAERADADGAVVLTLARAMSSTYQSAVLGAEGLAVPVRVVDTGTAAGAEALVVLAASAAAAGGEDLDGVEAAARSAIEQVNLVATVPSLDHLVRSGRVPELAGMAGRWLNVVPLFEFRDGRARPLRPAFTREAAIDRMLARWRRSRTDASELHVAAMHASAEDEAQLLLDRVAAEVTPVTAFVGEFNAVMVTHTGPGLLGLAWRWKPVESIARSRRADVTER
jgi:DegV family protein with EDD domain